jgi:hypothetical protein
MSDDIREKHQRAIQINDAATTQIMAEYQRAIYDGDQEAEDTALQNLAGLRATRREINAMAAEATGLQNTRLPGEENMSKRDVDLCRHYRLTPDMLATAKSWTNDPRVPDTERIETYLRNSNRYHHMRRTGQYVDEGDLQGDRRR